MAMAVLLCAPGESSAENKVRLRWSEAGRAIAGRTVTLALPGGSVTGKVLAVEPESLRMNIKKTSDRSAYATGLAAVPKSAVSLVRLEKRGIRWQLIGTAAGFLAGGLAGYHIAVRTVGEHSGTSGVAAAVGIMGAVTALGYALGRGADRKLTLIEIDPAGDSK